MNNYLDIKVCEVCGEKELYPVLDLGMHPLCDDLIPVGNSAECQVFPISILYCKKCFTAHQQYQVPKIQLFPRTYHYRSRFTGDVLSGMADLVDSVELQLNSLVDRTVLDIGCNDGSLLDRFASKGAKTIGVEPTGAFQDAMGRGHTIINDFFSEKTAMQILEKFPRVDVITFTNVFAHIEDLPALLRSLALLMNDDTLLVIENHYLGAVLDKNQFDTFYHEHPRTYTLNSFMHIAQTLGKEVLSVAFPSRYGGNIRVVIGNPKNSSNLDTRNIAEIIEHEALFENNFSVMNEFIAKWKHEKTAEIKSLVEKHGPLVAKAFPGRAAILVALLGLTDNEIECVYEKPGSMKIGHYLPGTRIEIRSDDELSARIDKLEIILNLAWHIPKEIEGYLQGLGFKGHIVHIV